MMTRSLSPPPPPPSSASPSGTNVSEGGEKEQEGERSKKRVGWYVQHVVCPSFDTFISRVGVGRSAARKNETLFKDGAATKTKRVLLATLRFEGERDTLR